MAQLQSNRDTPKPKDDLKESRGEIKTVTGSRNTTEKEDIKTVAGSRNISEKEERHAHKLSFGSVDELPLERLRRGESIKESAVESRKIEEPEEKPQREKLRINLEKASQMDSNRDEVYFVKGE